MGVSSKPGLQNTRPAWRLHVGFSSGDTQGEVLPTVSRSFPRSDLLRWKSSPKMRALLSLLLLVAVLAVLVESKDMLRKSIVFDKKTPDVFYCPQKKPKGVDKMIVKAKPLKKLCEFEGKPLPADYKSDCYNDVDETEYACKEKHRIMMRMNPPGIELLRENKTRYIKHRSKTKYVKY